MLDPVHVLMSNIFDCCTSPCMLRGNCLPPLLDPLTRNIAFPCKLAITGPISGMQQDGQVSEQGHVWRRQEALNFDEAGLRALEASIAQERAKVAACKEGVDRLACQLAGRQPLCALPKRL